MNQIEIVRLERIVMQDQAKLAVLHEENQKLRKKIKQLIKNAELNKNECTSSQ